MKSKYIGLAISLFLILSVLSEPSAFAQDSFIPLDRGGYLSSLAARATHDQLWAGRYDPTAGTPSTLERKLWLYGFCDLLIATNGYYASRDWCIAVRDTFDRGFDFDDLIASGFPPRMPPSPSAFPALDDTACRYYYPPPYYFSEFRCIGPILLYEIPSAEDRATSEAQLRGFTDWSFTQEGSGAPTDVLNRTWLRQHSEFLEQHPIIQHLLNMEYVKIWEVRSRLNDPTCLTCYFPTRQVNIGGTNYLHIQRAWLQPENNQVYFLFHLVISDGGDLFRPPSTTHRIVRYGAPVTIWQQGQISAEAYAQQIMRAHGAVQSEPFWVQLYRATMFGDSLLKWYDRCHFAGEWSPDWRLAKDLTIDTLSYVALIGSFGCGTPAYVALAIDAGFLVYETYDFICAPSWHRGIKAGVRLLGVAGASYFQYLQRKLPATTGDVATHIAPANTIQTGCKPAQYDEFITNQVNSAIYNMRGGTTMDEMGEIFRKTMKDTHLTRVNAADDALYLGGRWAEKTTDAEAQIIVLDPQRFNRDPRLRAALQDIQDDIVRHGEEIFPGTYASEVSTLPPGLPGSEVIATRFLDHATGRVEIWPSAQYFATYPYRSLDDLTQSIQRLVLETPGSMQTHTARLAFHSFHYSYLKPLEEGSALMKNLIFETAGTFVKRGQKVTLPELEILEPYKHRSLIGLGEADYLATYRRLFD